MGYATIAPNPYRSWHGSRATRQCCGPFHINILDFLCKVFYKSILLDLGVSGEDPCSAREEETTR